MLTTGVIYGRNALQKENNHEIFGETFQLLLSGCLFGCFSLLSLLQQEPVRENSQTKNQAQAVRSISVYDKSGDVYLNPVIDDISINNAVVIRKIYFNPKTNKVAPRVQCIFQISEPLVKLFSWSAKGEI